MSAADEVYRPRHAYSRGVFDLTPARLSALLREAATVCAELGWLRDELDELVDERRRREVSPELTARWSL